MTASDLRCQHADVEELGDKFIVFYESRVRVGSAFLREDCLERQLLVHLLREFFPVRFSARGYMSNFRNFLTFGLTVSLLTRLAALPHRLLNASVM